MPPLQDGMTDVVIEFIRSLPWVPADVAAGLTPETNIVRDLHLDSIAIMEFIMEFEIKFDVIIPLDTIAEIATIEDLAQVAAAQRSAISI